MKNFFRYLIVIVTFLAGTTALAQPYSVKLRLVEEKSSEAVPFATVSLTPAGSTKASKYALTDDKGAATITRVNRGAYVIKAEIMGYKNYELQIVVTKDVDLGTVKMAEDAVALDAAKVSAVQLICNKDVREAISMARELENILFEDLQKNDFFNCLTVLL